MSAGYRHPEALASTEWLAEHLGDPSVRIVDLRYGVRAGADGTFHSASGLDAYSQGHIPGALFVDFLADLSDPDDPIPMNILSPARFAALMGRLGVGDNTTVVVYDDAAGTWAARLWWALRYYGHDAVMLLDGGLTTWLGEGQEVQTTTPVIEPARFHPRPKGELRATCEQVQEAIGRAGVCIVDALPARFYVGDAGLFPTHRAGHIPTAVNVPAPANVDPVSQTLLPADVLEDLWRDAGVSPHQQVITYCGSGAYAAFDLFVLHLLGYESVSLYDGSWQEWGANPALPVETGSTSPSDTASGPPGGTSA